MKKRMKFVLIMLLGLAVLTLSACLQQEIRVNVQVDGSGSIEERWVVGDDLAMLLMMGGGFGGDDMDAPSLYDEEELASSAGARFGEGVNLVSVEPVLEDGWQGYLATYRFQNINSLRIDQDPKDPEGGVSEPSAEVITFRQERATDGTTNLRIFVPQDDVDLASPGPAPEAMDPDLLAGMEEFAEIYKGMKVLIEVVPAGRVISTDADLSADGRIVLLEADFSRILDDRENLAALVSLPEGGDMSSVKAAIGAVDGLNFESKSEVLVRYR